MTSTNDIRRSFLDYFEGAGHARVPSAPLVPHNDPTLMFVNAGMVPFKNVFTGLETRPYSTAASSQKCVRAGGKHNDLDNVGYTARHHTFFEMLGNFSFGDYFKEQAIHHAWTLITKEWGLSPDRLTVTVYHTDDEAHGLWRKIAGLPDGRIIRIPTSDNFWSMGDTGPCGPCSEIFFDHGDHIPGGPPGSPDEDGDRFVEIWNLVFMQYDQRGPDDRVSLPKPSIDTGMGLERIAAVMQGVHDNYDTDTFKALILESGELTKTATTGETQASHRIIADHLRTSGFLIADGVLPSNEGRGYVLRRIMRRAMRHAHLLGAKDPLMHRLVPSLVAEMGGAFPELVRAQAAVEATLLQEETQFRRVLDKGLYLIDGEIEDINFHNGLIDEGRFDEAASSTLYPVGRGERITSFPGDLAFKLYDTLGFPLDLTESALRNHNLTVDRVGFDAAMAQQKAMARAAWKGSGAKASDDVWFDIAERVGSTEFTGYTSTDGVGEVLAILVDGVEVLSAEAPANVTVITNQTPFYGESGGQMGDAGLITNDAGLRAVVDDTSKPLGRLHAHQAKIETGKISVSDTVKLAIDVTRRDQIRANHSATHLLHAALRNRLGTHVMQKGSLVAPDRLRFDFSNNSALSAEDIAAIETEVNAEIRANQAVTTRLMTPDDAVAAGALALFGEKYGDEVRVLSMGPKVDSASHYSVELCGGTHVNALGDIALFKIVSEGAVASGIRRVEAMTGEAARLWLTDREDRLKDVAASLKSSPEDVPARVTALSETVKRLEKELADAKKAIALGGGSGAGAAEPEDVGGVKFLAQTYDGLDPKDLRGLANDAKARIGSGVVALLTVNDGKASILAAVTEDLVNRFSAVDFVRAGVAALGGQGGGGKPDMAQGGGPEASQTDAAVAAVRALLSA
jgi:alanyl-tRNA synthetase